MTFGKTALRCWLPAAALLLALLCPLPVVNVYANWQPRMIADGSM